MMYNQQPTEFPKKTLLRKPAGPQMDRTGVPMAQIFDDPMQKGMGPQRTKKLNY